MDTRVHVPKSIRSWRKNAGLIVIHLLLVAGAAIVLLPVVWMVLSSLKQEKEIFLIPVRWFPAKLQFSNYVQAFRYAPFDKYYRNSAIVATTVTFATVLLSSWMGYGFAKFNFPGKNISFVLVLSTMMIPFQVIMIPLYLIVRDFGWLDSYLGLIAPGALTAFGVFLMRQFTITLPNDYIDAARIDGCGELGIWWSIVVPLTKPALSALTIFTFLGSWNELLWPLIITTKTDLRTIPLGLASFESEYGTSYALLMAASVTASIPVLIVFLLFQRQFMQGIVMSGLKG